jgi:hypothetical protein
LSPVSRVPSLVEGAVKWSVDRRKGERAMYGQLASVRDVVNLSPEETLDCAEEFLVSLGYTTLLRDDTSLVAKRDEPGRRTNEGVLNLKVVADPQPDGGVLIRVRGNDREGVRQHQAQWSEWAEGLPKRQIPGPPTSEADTQEDAMPAGDASNGASEDNRPDRTLRGGTDDGTEPGLD